MTKGECRPRTPIPEAPATESAETLQRLLDACNRLNSPIFVHDCEFRILYANSAYLARGKASLDHALGRPFWQVFPQTEGPLPGCRRVLTGGDEEAVEDICTDDNEIFCCRSLAVHSGQGGYLYSIHVMEEVTELRRLEEALRSEKALADATISCAPGIFFVVDPDGYYVRWNSYVNRITGLSDEELPTITALSIVHPGDALRIEAKLNEVFRIGYGTDESRLVTLDQGIRDFAFTARRFEVAGNVYLAGFGIDITDLKHARDRMEHLATHDRLTGLPNRNLFFDRLQHSIDKAARRGEHIALLFVDLDNFKAINDRLGHPMGDILLEQVADRLRACTRKQDTISRLGGDEFTVIAEDLPAASEELVGATAERMIAVLATPFDLAGNTAFLSASIGIAFYPKDGKDITALTTSADTAMYRAKEVGKNNYKFFTEEMNVHAAERRALEIDLVGALERGEFFLEYQPQVHLRSGQVLGVEALLRWRHPERGLLLPEQFIPFTETSGLVMPIGDWVLRASCAQLLDWAKQGVRQVRLAVNLSPRQFRQENLAERIASIMRECGISGSQLTLELTETCVMDDAAAATEILK
ncbi:MAG: diguanylate cyclase, partial [Thiohalobacteraceae bacterium]